MLISPLWWAWTGRWAPARWSTSAWPCGNSTPTVKDIEVRCVDPSPAFLHGRERHKGHRKVCFMHTVDICNYTIVAQSGHRDKSQLLTRRVPPSCALPPISVQFGHWLRVSNLRCLPRPHSKTHSVIVGWHSTAPTSGNDTAVQLTLRMSYQPKPTDLGLVTILDHFPISRYNMPMMRCTNVHTVVRPWKSGNSNKAASGNLVEGRP